MKKISVKECCYICKYFNIVVEKKKFKNACCFIKDNKIELFENDDILGKCRLFEVKPVLQEENEQKTN